MFFSSLLILLVVLFEVDTTLFTSNDIYPKIQIETYGSRIYNSLLFDCVILDRKPSGIKEIFSSLPFVTLKKDMKCLNHKREHYLFAEIKLKSVKSHLNFAYDVKMISGIRVSARRTDEYHPMRAYKISYRIPRLEEGGIEKVDTIYCMNENLPTIWICFQSHKHLDLLLLEAKQTTKSTFSICSIRFPIVQLFSSSINIFR